MANKIPSHVPDGYTPSELETLVLDGSEESLRKFQANFARMKHSQLHWHLSPVVKYRGVSSAARFFDVMCKEYGAADLFHYMSSFGYFSEGKNTA